MEVWGSNGDIEERPWRFERRLEPADGHASETSDASGTAADAESGEVHSSEADDSSESPPGHGRYGADDYPGAEQVDVKHPQYFPGDACPDCGEGTLYEKSPGVLMRFIGRSPLHATVYRMQKLRCHLCGKLFTAPTPGGIGDDKYDHSVASMIGLLKYGSGFPFSRSLRRSGPTPRRNEILVHFALLRPPGLVTASDFNLLSRMLFCSTDIHRRGL